LCQRQTTLPSAPVNEIIVAWGDRATRLAAACRSGTRQCQYGANQHHDLDAFRQRTFKNGLSDLPIISLNCRQRWRGYELSLGNLNRSAPDLQTGIIQR
jgi:hypothetical protein